MVESFFVTGKKGGIYNICIFADIYKYTYRVAKRHRIRSVAGLLSQKSHSILGSSAENDIKMRHLMRLRHPVYILTCVYVAKEPLNIGLFGGK